MQKPVQIHALTTIRRIVFRLKSETVRNGTGPTLSGASTAFTVPVCGVPGGW